MSLNGAGITSGYGTCESRVDADRARVGKGLLHEPAVDGQRATLIHPSRRAQSDDGIEQGDEPTRRQHRGRVVSGFAAAGQPDRDRAEGHGEIREQPHQSIVPLQGDRCAFDRLDGPLHVRRERDERMECSDLAAGSSGGLQDFRTQDAACVDQGLTAVEAHRVDDLGNRVVGDGEDRQLDVVKNRRGFHERAGPGDERSKPLAPTRVPARDGNHRPAGARDCHSERRTDRPGPDDADGRCGLPDVLVRVRIGMGVDLVAVAVRAGAVSLFASALAFGPQFHATLLPTQQTRAILAPDLHRRRFAFSRRNADGDPRPSVARPWRQRRTPAGVC